MQDASGNIGGVDRAADLRWKSGIRLRGTGGGTEDFKRSGLRLFYCGGAAVRVMADTFVCKGEKSILSEEIYIRLGTAWGNGRFRCTARAGFVFMGGFPHTSPHNPGGTESGAGNIFMCSSQGDRADHHAENLRQYRGTEAPVFTEDDLMQTADFFETGMQYMVKPGDRVTVYMEGPGFFRLEDF